MSACQPQPAPIAGTWGEDLPGQPHLVLAEDHTLAGSDGCNRLMGTWEEADETIQLGPLASTRMLCPEVDTWLSAAASATINDDHLVIFDESGAQIGTLTRSNTD